MVGEQASQAFCSHEQMVLLEQEDDSLRRLALDEEVGLSHRPGFTPSGLQTMIWALGQPDRLAIPEVGPIT